MKQQISNAKSAFKELETFLKPVQPLVDNVIMKKIEIKSTMQYSKTCNMIAQIGKNLIAIVRDN